MANAKKISTNFAKTTEPEKEGHIVIDKDRVIEVPKELREIAVQFDHNIETVTFDCPRYWDGNDMSKMTVYVNYMRSDGETGSCLCTNVVPDPINKKLMHFNWTIKRHVTEIAGALKFLVCITKDDVNGTHLNHWNSKLNDQLIINEGLETDLMDDNPSGDIVDQLVGLIGSKLDKNQGKDNSGKTLIINPEGDIIPCEVPGGSMEIGTITISDIDEIMKGKE